MDIKKIFKPTIPKIIVLMIIIILAHLPYAGYIKLVVPCTHKIVGCAGKTGYYYLPYLWTVFGLNSKPPINYTLELTNYGFRPTKSEHFLALPFLLMLILYWYTLSCLIISIYYRIKLVKSLYSNSRKKHKKRNYPI